MASADADKSGLASVQAGTPPASSAGKAMDAQAAVQDSAHIPPSSGLAGLSCSHKAAKGQSPAHARIRRLRHEFGNTIQRYISNTYVAAHKPQEKSGDTSCAAAMTGEGAARAAGFESVNRERIVRAVGRFHSGRTARHARNGEPANAGWPFAQESQHILDGHVAFDYVSFDRARVAGRKIIRHAKAALQRRHVGLVGQAGAKPPRPAHLLGPDMAAAAIGVASDAQVVYPPILRESDWRQRD